MKRLICKLFWHKWVYRETWFKVCTRCGWGKLNYSAAPSEILTLLEKMK